MNRLIIHMKCLLTILLCSAFTFNNVLAYTMPVGIPEPSLNFTQEMPDRPSDWSNEIPGYYYINEQTGSTTRTYGTPTAPRKYLPNTLAAGAYVEIGGELSNGASSGGRMFTLNGTDTTWVANTSGPIWITSAKESQGYIVNITFQMTGANVFIDGLNFKNGGGIQISSATTGYPAKNIVVRNIDVDGRGIGIEGSVSNAVNGVAGTNNIIVYNSSFHDAGDVNATYDQDSHLMTVGAGSSNVWLLKNVAHTASGAGLQVLGASTRGSTTNIYAGDNEIYNVRQSGMWVKYGSKVIFSSNHVHDIISTTWSVSKGMGAQYEPDELWMINNHVHGMEYGIRIASTNSTTWNKNVYAIGNIIHDIRPVQDTVGTISGGANSSWQSAGIHIAGSNYQYIYNNLIFDAPNGIDTSNPSPIYIKNNIILDVTGGQEEGVSGYHVLGEIVDPNVTLFMENNYIGDNPYVQIRHGAYTSADTLNTLDGVSNNIQGTNFITPDNINTIIDNSSTNSVNLSGITDLGTNVNDILITQFTSIFPGTNGINLDIFGTSRNLGDSIDIGPFEQNGAEPTISIPARPESIEVIQAP